MTKAYFKLPGIKDEIGEPLRSIRILVADDYEAWRRKACQLLQARPEFLVIYEASDGSETVQKAEELGPDLILLDIGLPKVNGIEAARQIRQHSPNSKIVFLSVDNTLDVVQEALSTGAQGYVYKARAQSDLLPAIDAVLRDEQFISSMSEDYKPTNTGERAPRRHEVLFYSDDAVFLDSFTRFIAAALKAGDVAIVVATESHQDSLIQRLKAHSLDIDAAIRQGTYITLDVAQALSAFMVNDMPESDRFFEVVGGLIRGAAEACKQEHRRVVACGECAPFLLAEGKLDAAIRLEQLWDQLATTYEVESLCGYALGRFQGEEDEHIFQRICAEHSTVFRA